MSYGLHETSHFAKCIAIANTRPRQMENGRQLLRYSIPDSHATCAKELLNRVILFQVISSPAWRLLCSAWQHHHQLHSVTKTRRATVRPGSSP